MTRLFLLLFTVKFLVTPNPNPVNESYKATHYSNGIHTFSYPNGNRKSCFKIKNGNLDSVLTVWFENGKISEMDKFDNGRFIDTNRIYNEAGQLLIEESFRHDTILYYREISYYPNGMEKQERTLEFDSISQTLCPFCKSTNANNRIYFDADLFFRNMKCHGKYSGFYSDGKIKTEAEIVNYIYQGDYKTYYENGNLSCKGSYRNNDYDGVFTYYTKNGEVKKTENWSNGKLTGK